MAEGDETACELVLFSCDSCYVYMVLLHLFRVSRV